MSASKPISPGLSPRVRGNQAQSAGLPAGRRSIPACAGEPLGVLLRSFAKRVYPRVCGGTRHPKRAWRPLAGLSPRVRGNPRASAPSGPRRGSIPACAGEPAWSRSVKAITRVYPRVCGGTIQRCAALAPSLGLSPRVRGNHARTGSAPAARGSIPACAGEPGSVAGRRWWARVYPRVCGGTGALHRRILQEWGLSPRVRGNPVHARGLAGRVGSIPACAGEPPTPGTGATQGWVYPRVCGGTCKTTVKVTGEPGLSPRVRGNRQSRGGQSAKRGSIPACAGEPP